MKPRIYFENLDALRFFAAFAVLMAHLAGWLQYPDTTFYKFFRIAISLDAYGGDAGVSFFFVLSGFLITYLMIAEKERFGSFDLLYFYARRILRIWPLYYLTLLIGFVIYPIVTTRPAFVEQANWWMYASFLTNFDHIYFGWPQTGILGVQWSLAVEEQFYLVWPLVFLLTMRSRYFPWAVGLMLVVSLIFRGMLFHKYHTLCALGDLATGALFAHIGFHHPDRVQRFFAKFSRPGTMVVYAAGMLLLLLNFQLNKRIEGYGYADRFIHGIFFIFIIMEQSWSPASFFKAGSVKMFSWLGRISYGMYLLHMVAIYLVLWVSGLFAVHVLLQICLGIVLTVLLSYLSYRYFESYFLKLKNRFTPHDPDYNNIGSKAPIY